MALEKVARRSLPDEVYQQLLGEMIAGSLATGDPLPSERQLAEVLGVSRPAVREALQRLAHAGLVEVRQGGSTTVTDFRRSGGLDLLPHLVLPGGEIDLKVARSIIEARRAIGPALAALAARRADADTVRGIRNAVDELRAELDPVERQRAALQFWEIVIDAADSVVFRLMFNSLRAAYEPALGALATVMAAEVDRIDDYDALADAVEAHDPELASARADELLSHATHLLLDALAWLDGIEGTEDD